MGERSAERFRRCEPYCLVAHQNGMLHVAGALGANCPAPLAAPPRLRHQLCGEHRADANTCSGCRAGLCIRSTPVVLEHERVGRAGSWSPGRSGWVGEVGQAVEHVEQRLQVAAVRGDTGQFVVLWVHPDPVDVMACVVG